MRVTYAGSRAAGRAGILCCQQSSGIACEARDPAALPVRHHMRGHHTANLCAARASPLEGKVRRR